MSSVIRVEGLGKKYALGQKKESSKYTTLRDVVANGARNLTSRSKRFISRGKQPSQMSDDFWALKDVSFEIEQGDRVGIIGRNGAGKSTLLKILSRITEPTEGRVAIKGRVASLLEVGTGFHPELTGRENIYLNGAILGMTKSEIKRKFDEIVAFAEVEKFLDTPVKRYSSGMYVRLAFAVAAHLEPEILVVDEVLAVGDSAFQKKCLGKMEEVGREGRTVLFVSHNIAAIQSLCKTGIVLDSGQLEGVYNVSEAIYNYSELLGRNPSNLNRLRGVKVLKMRINPRTIGKNITPDAPLVVDVEFFTEKSLTDCYLNLVVENSESEFLIHSRTDFYGEKPSFAPGLHTVTVEIPRISLRAGVYTAWFRLYVNGEEATEIADSERLMLEIEGESVGGIVDVPCSWSWTREAVVA